jgi:hypothetical protein
MNDRGRCDLAENTKSLNRQLRCARSEMLKVEHVEDRPQTPYRGAPTRRTDRPWDSAEFGSRRECSCRISGTSTRACTNPSVVQPASGASWERRLLAGGCNGDRLTMFRRNVREVSPVTEGEIQCGEPLR